MWPRTSSRLESMRASSVLGLVHMHPQQVRWLASTAGGYGTAADRRAKRRVGSWGARREERQGDPVMNVVHAIRGTLREAGADRPDDDEAVLVSEVYIEQDRGGYPTAGGLLAIRVGAPDGRGGGHDSSWGRWAAGGMVAVVTAVRRLVRRCDEMPAGGVA